MEPVLSLVPRFKGSRIARLVETSNAESPTPMYRYNTPLHHKAQQGLYNIHPEGIHRCFVFDQPIEFARFLNRQNQSVSKRLLCTCTPPVPTARYGSTGVGKRCKYTVFSANSDYKRKKDDFRHSSAKEKHRLCQGLTPSKRCFSILFPYREWSVTTDGPFSRRQRLFTHILFFTIQAH